MVISKIEKYLVNEKTIKGKKNIFSGIPINTIKTIYNEGWADVIDIIDGRYTVNGETDFDDFLGHEKNHNRNAFYEFTRSNKIKIG